MFESRARLPWHERDRLIGYPPRVRRVFHWFDGLSDWQRLRYALTGIVFLLACAGYLLGLGSTILLQRVEAHDAELAAQRLLTPEPTVAPTEEPVLVPVVLPSPTATAAASPTIGPSDTPTARPDTPTPFSAPQLSERPAVPRSAPVVVNPPPRAPVVAVPTPTAKPRNLENATPQAKPTAGRAPTALAARTPPAAQSQPAPATPTRAAQAPQATPQATPLPTLRVAATSAPTPANRPPQPGVPNPTRSPVPAR
jgi:hypothetical protein